MEAIPGPVPPAPWLLNGQALLLPGWRYVTALVHYDASPVGPYNEYARIRWLGRLSVVSLFVDSAVSANAGKALWGFPKEYAPVDWKRTGNYIHAAFNEQIFDARVGHGSWPLRRQLMLEQTLHGKAVRVPCSVEGIWQLALYKKKGPALALKFALQVQPPIFME